MCFFEFLSNIYKWFKTFLSGLCRHHDPGIDIVALGNQQVGTSGAAIETPQAILPSSNIAESVAATQPELEGTQLQDFTFGGEPSGSTGAGMATPQATTLVKALQNIHVISKILDETNGALTIDVFSTNEAIPNKNLDYMRQAIGLEFMSLVQNLRAVKPTDPIAMAHPNIHYNLHHHVTRRNWLAHGQGTLAPIIWNEVADSVYNDIPTIKSMVIAALQAQRHGTSSG